MNTRIRFFSPLIVVLLLAGSIHSVKASAQTQVPHTFEAGQPARASEVNENFDTLEQAIQQLAADSSTASGQVLTAIPLASEVRYLFAEFFRLNGSFPLHNDEAGAPLSSDIQNDFISSVVINGNVITVTFGNNADPAIQNDTLEFSPNITGDNIYFTCNPTGGVVSFFNQDSCVFVDEPPEPLTTIRKQVASAIPLASEAQWLVEDYYKHFHSWPIDNVAAGLEFPSNIKNNYVVSVSIVANAVIAAQYGNNAHALIAGETMQFTVVDNLGSLKWVCSVPNIHDRYTGFSNSASGCVLPDDPPPQPVVLIRQQIESGLFLAANLQDLVEQFRQANARWPESNLEAGAPVAINILNNYVTSVSIGTGGVITITYANDAHFFINGRIFTLIPTDNIGSISWACNSTTVADRYKPYECR